MENLVVHCKKSPYDVYIGRGSKWGNPFVIDQDGTREEVIAKYAEWIKTQPELIASLPELHGKILGCWCSPKPCHGDILKRMANMKDDIVRVCVCGGRDYTDKAKATEALNKMRSQTPPWVDMVVIHGNAKGADTLAKEWAIENNIKHESYNADWEKHGNSAGPIRNKRMLDSGLNLLVAFPGGRGTAHMVSICKGAKVRVWKPYG